MNARKEFNNFIKYLPTIKCAIIENDDRNYHHDPAKIIAKLNIGYSKKDMSVFLTLLNFDYDDGFGGQNLYGTIWFEDGTWASRGEYDGSEWWEYNKCPEIPNELKGE